MKDSEIRDRIKFVLRNRNVSVSQLAGGNGTPLQVRLNRQINGDTTITYETVSVVLDFFKDISADWLTRGEGVMERNKIVTPPAQHHHQEIHSDGAPIAITQSGDAHLDATHKDTKKEQMPSAPAPIDVEKMFREQDWAMVVSLIRQHDQEMLDMKDEHIAQLRHDIELLDAIIRSLTPSHLTK